MKAMSLIIFYHVFHFNISFLKCCNNLVAFRFIYPGIISSLCNEQWDFYFIYMEDR